jgi:hypothetical protein
MWRLSALALLLLLLTPAVISAQENKPDFSASFEADYSVQESGATKVTQKISLTNLTGDVYAKEYSLSLGSTNIENVSATDSLGKLKTEVKKSDKTTEIKLIFNEQVIGINKKLNFSLSYDVSDISRKNGQMWEITIPKLVISADITTYNLRLLVPSSFGEIHYISPTPIEVAEGAIRVFRFSREQLEKTGVSAAFGSSQVFDFELQYHLLNPNIFTGSADITLPPDTDSQQVLIESIDPKPLKIFTDQDGNYLATFELKGRQKLDIVAKGKIKLVEPSRQLQKLAVCAKERLNSQREWRPKLPMRKPAPFMILSPLL